MSQLNDVEEDPFDEFPPEIRQDVEGLMWLGHLESEVSFCGHTFRLRTLKADEELAVSILVKDYLDTMGQTKAWAWANVALSLVAVDGEEDFCPPIGPDKISFAKTRFKWVTEKWYSPVGVFLYGEFTRLSMRQLEALERIRDLSPRSLPTSSPSADSLIDQEPLIEADPDILALTEPN